ncbi:MAG: helix-turn-helix domain-containing protein [Anaerolineales bacterium]
MTKTGSGLTRLFGLRSAAKDHDIESQEMTPASKVNESQDEAGQAVIESNVQDFNPLPSQADSSLSSQEIFSEIGQRLRKRREMLSLTLEEIERHMRVKVVYLQALEQGALDDLPSPVQTRGMLANYAGFLDLDVDTILLRFADGLQVKRRERLPEPSKRHRVPMTVNTSLPPLRSFIAGDLLFGGGMVIMLVLFAIWGVNRILTFRSQTPPRATAPSISEILAGTPLPTLPGEVTLIPAEDTLLASTQTTTAEVPTLAANINVQLNIEAVERTYLRVTVDGKVQFDGRVVPGTAYPFEAAKQVDVLVGNAAALRITYNGNDLGLMGNFGEVVDRVYTAEGVTTPTFTPQPTATATQKITATPTELPTLTPSPTSTPESGG